MNKELKNKLCLYYGEISDGIICSSKKKRTFLKELKAEIEAFVDASPDADIEGIISVFGSPDEIAEGFNGTVSRKEMRKKLGIRKAVVLALVAALAVWGIFALISLIDVHSEAHGYFTEELIYIFNLRGGVLL